MYNDIKKAKITHDVSLILGRVNYEVSVCTVTVYRCYKGTEKLKGNVYYVALLNIKKYIYIYPVVEQ